MKAERACSEEPRWRFLQRRRNVCDESLTEVDVCKVSKKQSNLH